MAGLLSRPIGKEGTPALLRCLPRRLEQQAGEAASNPGPALVRCGGGRRTFPGGVTKLQWQKKLERKQRGRDRVSLARERREFEERRRQLLRELRGPERPWEGWGEESVSSCTVFSTTPEAELLLAQECPRAGGVPNTAHYLSTVDVTLEEQRTPENRISGQDYGLSSSVEQVPTLFHSTQTSRRYPWEPVPKRIASPARKELVSETSPDARRSDPECHPAQAISDSERSPAEDAAVVAQQAHVPVPALELRMVKPSHVHPVSVGAVVLIEQLPQDQTQSPTKSSKRKAKKGNVIKQMPSHLLQRHSRPKQALDLWNENDG